MAFEKRRNWSLGGETDRERERERKPAVHEIGAGSRPGEKCGSTSYVQCLRYANGGGERISEIKSFNTALLKTLGDNNTNNQTFFHLTN